MMTVDEYREHWGPRTRQLPNGRALADAGWILVGVGITRVSDPLAESNYSVAMRRFIDAAGCEPTDVGYIGPNPDETNDPDFLPVPPIMVAGFGHWACGWIDELVIRADRDDLVSLAATIADELDSYPVLDEVDWSEREWAANHPDSTDECYSDDPDCPCGRNGGA